MIAACSWPRKSSGRFKTRLVVAIVGAVSWGYTSILIQADCTKLWRNLFTEYQCRESFFIIEIAAEGTIQSANSYKVSSSTRSSTYQEHVVRKQRCIGRNISSPNAYKVTSEMKSVVARATPVFSWWWKTLPLSSTPQPPLLQKSASAQGSRKIFQPPPSVGPILSHISTKLACNTRVWWGKLSWRRQKSILYDRRNNTLAFDEYF